MVQKLIFQMSEQGLSQWETLQRQAFLSLAKIFLSLGEAKRMGCGLKQVPILRAIFIIMV